MSSRDPGFVPETELILLVPVMFMGNIILLRLALIHNFWGRLWVK
jgi:hypothetical protein